MTMCAEVPLAFGVETTIRREPMVQAFVGQKGRCEVTKLYDAQGRETDNYDKIAGFRYETDDAEVVTVVDDDALPKDARLEAVGVGVSRVRVIFDSDAGAGVRERTIQSEEIEVLEPPPGEAVTGEFVVRLDPLEA